MANYCYTLPILPGKEDEIRKWSREMISHNPDHDKFLRSGGVTREQVWIQRTPTMGSLAVVSLEVEDPQKAFKLLATSSDPYAIKFREFLKRTNGIDFSQPMTVNELAVDWGVSEKIHIER